MKFRKLYFGAPNVIWCEFYLPNEAFPVRGYSLPGIRGL